MMRLSPRSAALCAAFALAASAVSAQSLPGGGDIRSSGLGGLLNGLSSFTQKESPEEEARSGEDIAAPVLGAAPPWKNSIVQRYVNLVGRRVADQAERRDVAWRFAVIDSPSINAMAFPGGIVVVTRGLYALLDTEDELAAVLGHEIAHVNRKHQWKVIRQQKLVALAEGRITGKDASKTSKLVADLGAKLIARGLDKSAEFEADRDGAVLAARAGYDSSALISVMQKLSRVTSDQGDASLLFATHPAPAQRIEQLVAAASPELEAAAVPSPAAARLKSAHSAP